ncbi:patatin-like phospholipase family protein [Nocardia camponoti]|uniref:Patatin family protein n=1 Tax=Nocardia camponoti TaxID=1616106 RepID=A0A917QLU5_9NOCA|nr:patatin family protein [Nocardia camponoti]GGK56331.1 patatin family protein [Nocardia camponoti]
MTSTARIEGSSTSAPSAADVIASRSETGRRDDGHRLALVIEGGGSRGVYSSGMVHALEELGLTSIFDAVYGTSAGAINGAWLLSGRASTGMRAAWTDPEIMRRAIDPSRVLRWRPVFDLRYLVHNVYDGIQPMDFDAILGNSTTFHPMATDIHTGLSVDLHPFLVDKPSLLTALRASAGLPLLAGPPVSLGGRAYFDGGLAETVPIRAAVAAGATHALVLRTRREDERRPPASLLHRVVGGGYMRAIAPGAFRAWMARPQQQDLEDEFLASRGDAVLQVFPPADAPPIDSASRDTALLAQGLVLGNAAMRSTLRTRLG